jgi:hypothetical protein
LPTITNTPLYQTRQEVFQTELEVFHFHPGDMHTSSPKIKEVIEFQRGLSVKRNLEKLRQNVID